MTAGVTMVRARDSEGRFIADDPSTPDVNEAWTTTDNNDTTTEGEV